MNEPTQTVRIATWVYGEDGVDVADPAEALHEASKLYPGVADHRVRGGRLLAASAEMQATTVRAVKRNRQLAAVSLPCPQLPPTTLADAMHARQSDRAFGRGPIPLDDVATLLGCCYGVSRTAGDNPRPLRTVPSGGALYPLELYVAASAVSGLDPALYHFDPLRRVLERLRPLADREELARLCPYPELFADAAAIVFITAMFWRTRFKYGLRGYRFALLEAGHVGQNLALAATALGLAAVPVGGFYDARLDELLGVDGVNESALYAFSFAPKESP